MCKEGDQVPKCDIMGCKLKNEVLGLYNVRLDVPNSKTFLSAATSSNI